MQHKWQNEKQENVLQRYEDKTDNIEVKTSCRINEIKIKTQSRKNISWNKRKT